MFQTCHLKKDAKLHKVYFDNLTYQHFIYQYLARAKQLLVLFSTFCFQTSQTRTKEKNDDLATRSPHSPTSAQ